MSVYAQTFVIVNRTFFFNFFSDILTAINAKSDTLENGSVVKSLQYP